MAAAQPEAPKAAVAEEVIISTPAAASAPAPAPAAPEVSAAAPFMMPAAEKLMANSGLSASQVAGTGVGGRITKPDVIAALKSAQPVAPLSSRFSSGSAGRAEGRSRQTSRSGSIT